MVNIEKKSLKILGLQINLHTREIQMTISVAILNLGVMDYSYDFINIRNKFPMPELVKNNFLIIEIAQKMNIL